MSPASGTVFSIMKTDDPLIPIHKNDHHVLDMVTEQIGGQWPYTVISIMMTPLDVHIQRAPSRTTCTQVSYRSWSFLNAISDSTKQIAVWRNEANTMFFRNETSSYAVIQIAWFLARKIRCYIKPKQELLTGEPIGFIVLWSQVTMVVDSTIDITAIVWQRVIDGESIIWIQN